MDSKEAKVYNIIANQYNKNKEGFYSKECLDNFFMYLNPHSQILDLGCGPGQVSKVFSEAQHSVTSLDFSEAMLKIASREVPNASFVLGDIRELGNIFYPKSFDGIWAGGSLLHMSKKEIPDVFNQIHGVLRDNGIFYLSLKQGEGEKDIIDNRYNNIPRHFSYFQFMELSDLLVKSKFKPIHSSSTIGQYETPTGKEWIHFIVKKE
jgi:ubiquinone/menaquinone biosynthesis C-methylase UbiE